MWKFIHRKKQTPSSKESLAENAVAGGSFSVLPDALVRVFLSRHQICCLGVDGRPTAHSIASDGNQLCELWECCQDLLIQ